MTAVCVCVSLCGLFLCYPVCVCFCASLCRLCVCVFLCYPVCICVCVSANVWMFPCLRVCFCAALCVHYSLGVPVCVRACCTVKWISGGASLPDRPARSHCSPAKPPGHQEVRLQASQVVCVVWRACWAERPPQSATPLGWKRRPGAVWLSVT